MVLLSPGSVKEERSTAEGENKISAQNHFNLVFRVEIISLPVVGRLRFSCRDAKAEHDC
jgi:hypothetical protein